MVVTVSMPDMGKGVDRDQVEKAFGEAASQLGGFFALWICLGAPFVIGTVIGAVTLGIAGLVFAIQALVVGSETYMGQTCQNKIGVWLIVYGSLMLASTVLTCCCKKSASAEDDCEQKKQGNFFTFIGNVAGLAAFGWLCYGVNIVYSSDGATLRQCNPSQYDVFHHIVMFMFWGTIAVMACALTMCCFFIPICVVQVKKTKDALQANATNAQSETTKAGTSFPTITQPVDDNSDKARYLPEATDDGRRLALV